MCVSTFLDYSLTLTQVEMSVPVLCWNSALLSFELKAVCLGVLLPLL